MSGQMRDQDLFFCGISPEDIIKEYGSAVYVYQEAMLRERCRDLKNLVKYQKFIVDYSIKANSNPALLKIIREEGLEADVMSPGEIYIAEMAGYLPEEIFYIGNNVSEEEMLYAINKGIRVSLDSLSQLERFGKLARHGSVSIRVNPGIGAGHHQKVITAGERTKFGINTSSLKDVKRILEEYDLTLTGINQHIGSQFLKGADYLKSLDALFAFALEFPDLEFIDFGGGFGIPYKAKEGEGRLNLSELGDSLDLLISDFVQKYGREIFFRIESGRYIVAECGVLLGTVNAIKYNNKKKIIGTDIGFNVLIRPVLYDSYHEIEFYRAGHLVEGGKKEMATVVGNICESGDILAEDRELPLAEQGDIIAVRDAGAYGHIMSSTYNGRLRTAEVLLTADGKRKEIRKRDTFEDLVRNYIV